MTEEHPFLNFSHSIAAARALLAQAQERQRMQQLEQQRAQQMRQAQEQQRMQQLEWLRIILRVYDGR